MFIHEFTQAIRHIFKKKVYSIIILLSLAVSFTCTTLLTSFLIAEKSTDNFHHNKNRTFQLFSNDPFGGKGNIAFIPDQVAEYLKDTYPEVETVCRLANLDKVSFETRAGKFSDVTVISADSTFFDVFSFPLQIVTPKHAMNTGSITITEKQASRLFGETDPIGETILLTTSDTSVLVSIAGIFAPSPENSHLKFDAVIHHSTLANRARGGASYVMLKANTLQGDLTEKINSDPQRPGLIGPGKSEYSFVPVEASYFADANKMPYMRTRTTFFISVCSVVCGIIFFMGSFNFANLLLLFMHERKKETGIKKTLGITLRNLIASSVAEVLLYIGLALIISFAGSALLLNAFNDILGSSLSTKTLVRYEVVVIIVSLTLLSGMVVATISAIRKWKTKPVSLMKSFRSKKTFSSPFFYLQFIISVTLVICAVTIIRQMDFVRNESLGFNRNILQLQAPSMNEKDKLNVIKKKLVNLAGISNATICSGNPISGNSIVRYELEDGTFYTPYIFSGDDDFLKTLNLKLLEGKLSDGTETKLVNETFVRYFNLKNPVGERIPGTEDVISGVVKDFTCGSFKEQIPPVIITLEPNAERILVDYSGSDLSTLVPQIETVWKEVFPESSFYYQVIIDDLLKKYKEEMFFYRIIIASAVASIMISLFGLFALSWSAIQSKVKEIGIRKVLGATSFGIFNLLTLTFIKRISIAFILAAPMGLYISHLWLENFVNRISLNGWVVVYAAVIVIIMTAVTITLQTIKAAMMNPVDELKSE